MSELGKRRPIEQQTWRRHHTGRGNYGPQLSPTSGCQRRRRKAIMRRLWAVKLRRKALGLPELLDAEILAGAS